MVKSDNEALAVLEARIRAAPQKYAGLATGALDTPTELTAGTAPGYARVPITYAIAASLVDDGGGNILATLVNSVAVIWPVNSGVGPWPIPKVFLLFDALTGGSSSRKANLQDPNVVILPGQSMRLAIGTLIHTER